MTIEPTGTIEFGQYLHAFLVEALALITAGCMGSLLLTALWLVIVMRYVRSGGAGPARPAKQL